jgi:hypothetical protein
MHGILRDSEKPADGRLRRDAPLNHDHAIHIGFG